MNYKFLPEGRLDQGDILRQVPMMDKILGDVSKMPRIKETYVMVVSDPCEIDKPANCADPANEEEQKLSDASNPADKILVARVGSLSSILPELGKLVRKRRVVNLTHLPGEDPMPVEAYVDWRTIQPVDKDTILRARESEKYVCTVVGTQREAMYGDLMTFLFRNKDSARS